MTPELIEAIGQYIVAPIAATTVIVVLFYSITKVGK